MARILVALCALLATVIAHPHHRRGPPPCGLPPFVEDLPEEIKTRVEDIWKNYKEGEKCYEEQGRTHEIMESLTKEQRRAIHKGGFLPPFLRSAPKDIQEQFKVLFKDHSMSREERRDKVKELAKKILTGDLLEKFNKHEERVEKMKAEIQQKVEKLSKEAREAYDQIEKLESEKRDILHALEEDARDEVMELLREKRGPRHGPPHH